MGIYGRLGQMAKAGIIDPHTREKKEDQKENVRTISGHRKWEHVHEEPAEYYPSHVEYTRSQEELDHPLPRCRISGCEYEVRREQVNMGNAVRDLISHYKGNHPKEYKEIQKYLGNEPVLYTEALGIQPGMLQAMSMRKDGGR